MAWTYDQLIAEMHTRHNQAQGELYQARIDYNAGYTKWNASNDHGAIDSCLRAIYHNNQAIEYALFSDYYGYNGSTNLIPTALDRNMACPFITEAPEPEPYELTMTDMLKAMNDAESHQPLLFVGYLEAYYASVWNASFDTEFFAELVKKWSIWG